MKILFLGTGGIGRRHARNIKVLRPGSHFLAVRSGPNEVTQEFGMDLAPNLEAAISETPDAAIVALPTGLLAAAARPLLEAGIPLYLEKPLATERADLAEAIGVAEARGVVTLTGYCLRFVTGFKRIRSLIQEGELGRVVHANLRAGQWLPDWRPGRDYRETYSTHCDMGGGALNDLSHEIDLARLFFGEFDKVRAVLGNSGALEMDCEDYADVLLGRQSLNVNLHMDYLDRAGGRQGRILFEQGTLVYDTSAGVLDLYRVSSGQWESLASQETFDVPAALRAAMAEFLDCVDSGNATRQSISDGLKTLALIEQARVAGDARP